MEEKIDNPRLIDKKAVEIMDKLDYDFSEIIENMNPMSQLAWVARSLHTDRKIRDVDTPGVASMVHLGIS